MSGKPGQYSKHNYLYPVLSAAAQSMTKIAGTWDICSHSQKAEILHNMEQLTAAVIEAMAESLEQQRQTKGNGRRNS